MRCTVEVSKVDGGSHCAGYNTIKEALASASLAAFILGGHDCAVSVASFFSQLHKPNCPRVSYEPSLREWSITVRKHA